MLRDIRLECGLGGNAQAPQGPEDRNEVEDVAQGPTMSEARRTVAQRPGEVLAGLLETPLPAGLYVVATPIGNLADITLRALAVLSAADVLYCEDTRRSRTLLAHYAIGRPVRAYHEHNAARERPRVMAALAAGKSVALISDAGTPLVSDPGYKLVRAAIDAGFPVTSLPGPSALLTGLVASGLAADAFLFAGFLPPRHGGRRTRLAELKAVPATLIFFEAPSRLADSLADIAGVLGDRQAAVARELTKLHEEVRRGPVTDLARWAREAAPKGEVMVLVAPAPAEAVTDAAIIARLESLVAHMSLSDAAKLVADELSVPKARAYDLGLALKRRTGG
jgi:16S rRNA (cytidine1402-2'-O)-methyltransferase